MTLFFDSNGLQDQAGGSLIQHETPRAVQSVQLKRQVLLHLGLGEFPWPDGSLIEIRTLRGHEETSLRNRLVVGERQLAFDDRAIGCFQLDAPDIGSSDLHVGSGELAFLRRVAARPERLDGGLAGRDVCELETAVGKDRSTPRLPGDGAQNAGWALSERRRHRAAGGGEYATGDARDR